jgi:hypothetical protein
VVEYELPAYEVVPAALVSQVAVRTIHELYEADTPGYLESIVFNGFVETVNAATGKVERPYLVTLRAFRQRFLDRDFSRLDAKACLNTGSIPSQIRTPTTEAAARPAPGWRVSPEVG